MRVLLLSQHYQPEVTAAPFRLGPLAAGLAQRGHEVEVVTAVPNHPQGVVHPGYEGRLLVRRELDGVQVSYAWMRASPSKRARSRLAGYATYAAAAAIVGAARHRPDVILASSPPLSVGAVGALLSKRFRAPWVLDVRDLWPQIALVLGELSNRQVAGFASWLERRLYRSAAAVTTVTQAFVDHVADFTDRDKVHLVPNGTTRMWLDLASAEVDRGELGLPGDRFLWTYAGNVGLSQDLEAAVEAAKRLGEGYCLLILGEGPARDRLVELAVAVPDGQVEFRDTVPVDVAARIMRASDALLVSLADQPALGQTIPVKLYDSCAVGRPVLVAAPGELHRLAAEQGAGLPVAPNDPDALAEAVRRLAGDPALRADLSRSGNAFAGAHLREAQVEPLERVLDAVVGRS